MDVDFTFPLSLTELGELETCDYEQSVRQSLILILSTERGERVLRPDFGSSLRQFVFCNMDSTLSELAKTEAVNAVKRWEDRVEDVTAVAANDINGMLSVEITCHIKRNGKGVTVSVLRN
jgi:phage baseplate assembly protein W